MENETQWRRERRERQEAALRSADSRMVEVPLWALEALKADRHCNVCVGLSPSWDGHDLRPTPCRGAARLRLLLALKEADSGE